MAPQQGASTKLSPIHAVILALIALCCSACNMHKEEHHEEQHQILVTSPHAQDVTITSQYVCQIHSQRHIEIRALEQGYLEKIAVKEGQQAKAGDVLFSVIPVLYQTRAEAEQAEAKLAQLELNYTKSLHEKNVVSDKEVALKEATLLKAKAKAQQAAAELNFTKIVAPYDGIIDRLHHQQGSLVEEGEILTTLSDNSLMWVYFNVPEKAYLEYMANRKRHQAEDRIELKLANQDKYPFPGMLDPENGKGAIEGQFNNQTGNIAFRADFMNPDRVLRHGQTGTILINRTLDNAVVIPQRATFELLDKRYVWVIDEDNVAHQRLITVKHELEDIFIIDTGLEVTDKIVFEGIREVEEDQKVEFEFRQPEDILKNQKFHAE
jgi:membrane fusion protein (multidrug efflux system)